MNTKLIQNTTTLSLPNFPMLYPNSRNRIITKHFTNLAMHMDKNELAMLNWLVYQTHVDNTFTYSSQLLQMYRKSIMFAGKEYSNKTKLKTSLTFLRHTLKSLIEKGYVLPKGKDNKLMVNIMLTFHPRFIKNNKWEQTCQEHQELLKSPITYQIIEFTNKILKP